MTDPEGASVCEVQDLTSRMGREEGVKSVCGGRGGGLEVEVEADGGLGEPIFSRVLMKTSKIDCRVAGLTDSLSR